jgi:nucleotide-binding universal stress UspA family protein
MEQIRTRFEGRSAERPGEFGFPRILCAVDGTADSFAAVEQAAALAGPGGLLTLLSVTSYEAEGAYRSPAIGPLAVEAMLNRASAIAATVGVPSTIDVDPEGPPSHVVLDWAADCDLLAMGAPTTSWFGSMFTGGVATVAETHFATPLLIARAPSPPGDRDGPLLVASDGHAGSEELVLLAGRIARERGAKAILVHASSLESRRRREAVERQGQRLGELMEGNYELRVEPGNARGLIVETAVAAGASLIVMSSRRPKGPRALGSVSRWVVHQGPCSVLLAPQELLGPPRQSA